MSRYYEDAHRVAERLREALSQDTRGASAPLAGATVDRKLAPDMVMVQGWGFAIEIDGKQHVVGVEPV